MKRVRDEPAFGKYSCYTYDGNEEEPPNQHLHFVDVGLRLVSHERLVDPETHAIVPGMVGEEALASLSSPPSSPLPQLVGGGGLHPFPSLTSSSSSAMAQKMNAHISCGLRNLEQRLQPVAKGFPALQYFSCPSVVGADAHPSANPELTLFYIKDNKAVPSRAVQQLASASSSGGGSGSSSSSQQQQQQQCPFHYFRCSCEVLKPFGTALRRLYEEFNGAFDWDVYVAEEEERRKACIASSGGSLQNRQLGRKAVATTGTILANLFGGGAATNTPSMGGGGMGSTTSPASSFSTFPTSELPPNAFADTVLLNETHSVGGMMDHHHLQQPQRSTPTSRKPTPAISKHHSAMVDLSPTSPNTPSSSATLFPIASVFTSGGKFRPSLTAPKRTAFCVGSGTVPAVELRPIPPSLVAGNSYWHDTLSAYDRLNNAHGGGGGGEGEEGQEGSASAGDHHLDIGAIQCLYEAIATGTEEELLSTVASREGMSQYRLRQNQQRYCGNLMAMMGGGSSQQRAEVTVPAAPSYLGVVLFLNVPQPLEQPHHTSDTAHTADTAACTTLEGTAYAPSASQHLVATHAVLFITSPNAPLALSRRVVGPMPLLANDTPLSVMSALALHTRTTSSASLAPTGGVGNGAPPAAIDFPTCSTCKRHAVGLILCKLCNRNRVCPPPPPPRHFASGNEDDDTNRFSFSASLLRAQQDQHQHQHHQQQGTVGCYLQYQCSTCHTVTCANCCVRMTVNGIPTKRCLECLHLASE